MDYVVGGHSSHFKDDIEKKCSYCGCNVYFRPETLRMNSSIGATIVCLKCVVEQGIDMRIRGAENEAN